MESVHDFPSLWLCDYEIALREHLKLRKNLRKEDWYKIGVLMTRREGQGKESEILLNSRPLTAKKVRKKVLRNRKLGEFHHRSRMTELPVNIIIRTPPSSPSGEPVLLIPPEGLQSDPKPRIHTCHNGIPNALQRDPPACATQSATRGTDRGTDQGDSSRFRHLREDIPFNQFMPELLDLNPSYRLVNSPSLSILALGERTWTPGPRLFGENPSLGILARFTFQLSNKLFLDWRLGNHCWFLNWLGVSADFEMLTTFFSGRTPTVRAMYERLSSEVRRLRSPAPARVLFEIQHAVRKNNAIIGDAGYFLRTAVQIGSREDGMLEVAERALECIISPPLARAPPRRPRHLQSMFMVAAAQRDIAMLRLLVGTVTHSDSKTELRNDAAPRLLALIMRQIYLWVPERPEDNGTVAGYIQLLIQGGVLSTSISPPCCWNDRLQVSIRNYQSLTVDELIMLCPTARRKFLYSMVLQWSSEHRTSISRAGIFTAASDGASSLLTYLQSRNHNQSLDAHVIMQECLLFAASLNDTKTVSALLGLGTDPAVGVLSNNMERYHKGVMPWNPMIVAAAAGNLETLDLLKEKVNLDSFVRMAPVFEIVQLEDAHDKYGIPAGRELLRLGNLQRHYLYSQSQIADAAVLNGAANIQEFRYGEGFVPPEFFLIEKRRIDTLAWLRNVATASDVKKRLDNEIIKAALVNDPRTRAVQRQHPSYHPCDVLLLDGLLDAYLNYQEGDMDLLHICIRNQCSLKVVEFLLSKGLYVHSRAVALTGNTMLHEALLSQSCDRSEIVNLLLRQGADCTHNGEGFTILEASLQGRDFHRAAGPFPDYLGVFANLLESGAPVQQRPRPQLKEWSSLICRLVDADAEDGLILRILDAGAELNERGRNCRSTSGRMTPLEAVISDKRETLAQQLIERGANVHAPAGIGFAFTALQAACRSNCSMQFIEYLVRVQQADANEAAARKGGMTALQWAAFHGSLSVAEFLLEQGAAVNALSGSGQLRALDYAAMGGRLDMVGFLLRAEGRSAINGLGGAIDIAEVNGHSAVVQVLLHWNKEYGSRITRAETAWQQENPDSAQILLESSGNDGDSIASTSDCESCVEEDVNCDD